MRESNSPFFKGDWFIVFKNMGLLVIKNNYTFNTVYKNQEISNHEPFSTKF